LTTGCSSPAGRAGTGAGAGVGAVVDVCESVGTVPATLPVTEETDDVMELVTPPRRDEASERVSADAAVEDIVNQPMAAAPASNTGRMARHGKCA